LTLLDEISQARPTWQFVLIGPIVNIDPATLPRHDNIHYLGMKPYEDLPRYLASWDVAILPLARNEATRFMSPTKIWEYLAAGKPVVCTGLHDIVHPYGRQGLVHIADTAAEFIAAIESAMVKDLTLLLPIIDATLAQNSWDRIWLRMKQVIEGESFGELGNLHVSLQG
jgi:UDP-galactopyranose mutase